MKKNVFSAIFFLLLCAKLSPSFAQGQLLLDNQGYTAQSMVTDFFDSTYVTISNIVYHGDSNSLAFFDASTTNMGMNAGLLMTTGIYSAAMGPNINTGTTGMTTANYSDADLATLAGFPSYDASVIEFDLVPAKDTIWFRYVFGSEEYMEFANTSFNDVFAFLISGPNPAGGSYTNLNIATLPGTTTAVGVNSINCSMNSNYYVCNEVGGGGVCVSTSCPASASSTVTEFDGYTVPMTCYAIVTPGQTYHAKIGVTDVSDQAFDSGVFLDVQSLGGGFLKVAAAGTPATINGNTIQMSNKSKYATSYFWDFGDGTSSTLKNPVHTFPDLVNQSYTVTMIATNYCSSDTVIFQVGKVTSLQVPISSVANIFPNPAKEMLSINLLNQGNSEVKLMDVSGKTVIESNFTDNIQIPLTNLETGVYLLQLRVGERVYTTKVIHF